MALVMTLTGITLLKRPFGIAQHNRFEKTATGQCRRIPKEAFPLHFSALLPAYEKIILKRRNNVPDSNMVTGKVMSQAMPILDTVFI